MNVSNWSGLWLLSFLVPVVLLYLLKTRRKRLVVPSTWLWSASARDLKARHPFRRLRLVLPLVLQISMIVLLGLAATRPFSAQGDPLLEHVAIIIDSSASMQARDSDTTTRFDAAKQAARRIVTDRAPHADVMLLSASSNVQVIAPFERDRRRLLRRIDALRSNDTEGTLANAVHLAAARLRGMNGKRQLIVITDGALADRTPIVADAVDLEIIRVGAGVPNAAIVHIDVRTDPRVETQDPNAGATVPVRVFVRVRNFSEQPKGAFLTLRQRNVEEPLASRKIHLKPAEDAAVVLSFDATRGDFGTGVVVELSPGDALPVDDRAYALIPEGRGQRVVLYPPGKSPWLERALRADPDVHLFTSNDEGSAQKAGAEGALVIYAHTCPTVLPNGHFVVLNPPEGSCLTVSVGAEIEYPKVTYWRESDPRLRFLSLGDLRIQRARSLGTNNESEVLLRTQRGVLMAHVELQGRIGTIVGFDFGESDWPLKASFVLFVRNLVEGVRERRLGTSGFTTKTGSPLRLTVPLDVREVEVQLPGDSAPTAYPAKQGLAVLPPFARAGFYHASWGGSAPGSRLLVANLLSEEESNLVERPLPRGLDSKEGALPSTTGASVGDLTFWFAALALSLFLFEIVHFTRNRKSHAAKLRSRPVGFGGVR